MKKLLFLLILATCTSTSYAQDCQYETNIIDEFTGVRRVKTYSAMLTPTKDARQSQTFIIVYLEKIDSISYISFSVMTDKPVYIEDKKLAMIKLNNDSIIQLQSPSLNMNSEIVREFYIINQRYPIDKKQLLNIGDIGIKKIRVETTGGNVDTNISDTGIKNLRSFIYCLYHAPDPNIPVQEVKKKVKKNYP